MKNVLAALLLVAVLAAGHPARAQVYGQLTGTPVPLNGHLFGAYLHASQHVVGALAQLRLSFYPDVDFGFQGGLTRLDPGGAVAARTTLRVGTDVRWRVAQIGGAFPMDLVVGGALGIETADKLKVVWLGPTAAVSRALGPGGGLLAFGGLAFLVSTRDAFGVEDTDLSLPLRMGLEGRVAPDLRVLAEVQFLIADRHSDDVGFVAGVNLPF